MTEVEEASSLPEHVFHFGYPSEEIRVTGEDGWTWSSEMAGQDFFIRYPVFALKRDAAYVGYEFAEAGLPGDGFAIPVFTRLGYARQFLSETAIEAQVVPFDRVGVFRRFLRPLRDQGAVILFDVLPHGHGKLRTAHAYPAAVVLERFLPEPGFGWNYPLYVLKYRHGFACVQAEHCGAVRKWLAVFTDADLADRAVAAAPEPLVVMPVEDRGAFSRLVRGLSADVEGAAFDPPDPRRGGRPACGMPRHHLLANLDMEI